MNQQDNFSGQEQPSRYRVWLYARSGHPEPNALASQLERLSAYAEENRLQVQGCSTDQDTGRSLRRKGLRQMMNAVRNNMVDGVVVQDVERISYDPAVLFKLMRFLQQHSVSLITTETSLEYELNLRGLAEKLRRPAGRSFFLPRL